MNLRRMFKFLERRHKNEPVPEERRKNPRSRHERAQDELHDAIHEFDKTVRTKREDFFRFQSDAPSATVQFHTYRDICPQRGPEIMQIRYCRHGSHPDKGTTAHTICEESKCPRLMLAMKGIAA